MRAPNALPSRSNRKPTPTLLRPQRIRRGRPPLCAPSSAAPNRKAPATYLRLARGIARVVDPPLAPHLDAHAEPVRHQLLRRLGDPRAAAPPAGQLEVEVEECGVGRAGAGGGGHVGAVGEGEERDCVQWREDEVDGRVERRGRGYQEEDEACRCG